MGQHIIVPKKLTDLQIKMSEIKVQKNQKIPKKFFMIFKTWVFEYENSIFVVFWS